MFRNSATIRITLTLASVTLTALLVALALGLFPDGLEVTAHGRKALCETVTVSCSLAAQRGDRKTIESTLDAIVKRNPDVLSAALRRPHGMLHTAVGEHQKHWLQADERSTLTARR